MRLKIYHRTCLFFILFSFSLTTAVADILDYSIQGHPGFGVIATALGVSHVEGPMLVVEPEVLTLRHGNPMIKKSFVTDVVYFLGERTTDSFRMVRQSSPIPVGKWVREGGETVGVDGGKVYIPIDGLPTLDMYWIGVKVTISNVDGKSISAASFAHDSIAPVR